MVVTAIDDTTGRALDNAVFTAPAITTRRATFALNKKKLTNTLVKDAHLESFEVAIHNFDQNVNVKCYSGFFFTVANPVCLDLARQCSDSSKPFIINNHAILCTNNRTSLDEADLRLNVMYTYDITNPDNLDQAIASVTIHCHTTTQLVQLQGSKLVESVKAPVWFYNNILKDTLVKESEKRKQDIDVVNSQIIENKTCSFCKKSILPNEKYVLCPTCSLNQHKRCSSLKSSKSRLQPSSWVCDLCLPNQRLSDTNPRKRALLTDDAEAPQSKSIALGSPIPKPLPRASSDSTSLSMSPPTGTLSLLACSPISSAPTLTSSVVSSSSTPSLPNLNVAALPFVPMPSPSGSAALSYPAVTVSSSSTVSTTSLTPSITIPIPSPISQVSSFPTSNSSSQSLCPQSVELPKQKKQTKSTKSKPTLATSPEDFEKENLKVERDFARLKVRELDQELKSQTESLDILTARCRLLEDQRNKSVSSSLNPSRDKDVVTNASPMPSVSSPLESLINLEVIRAIKEHSKPDKPTHEFNIISKLDSITEKLEIVFENEKFLNNKLDNIQVALNDVHKMCSTFAPPPSPPNLPDLSPPLLLPSSTTYSASSSVSVAPATTMSKTTSPSLPRSSPPSKIKNSLLHPKQKSCLGPPPRFKRKLGVCLPLSQDFLRTHSRTAGEGKRQNMSAQGPSSQHSRSKPSWNPPPPPRNTQSLPSLPAGRPQKPPSRSNKYRTKIYERTSTITASSTTDSTDHGITLIDVSDEMSHEPVNESLSLLDNEFISDVFGDPFPDPIITSRAISDESENIDLISLN